MSGGMNRRARWAALTALAMTVLVIGLDLTVLNVALPTLSEDLHATTAELQWVVNAYMLAFAGAMLPAGWLGDRFGRARVLVWGLAAFGAASVAAAYSAGPASLVVSRAAMGLGAAVVMPLAMAQVPALFVEAERQRAVTVMMAAVGLGLPLGPVAGGGVLLDRFWWGSVFLATVPVVIVSLVACAVLLPSTGGSSAPRPDLVGGTTAVLAIVVATYALVAAPGWGWMSTRAVGCLVATVVLSTIAVQRQRVAPVPLVHASCSSTPPSCAERSSQLWSHSC